MAAHTREQREFIVKLLAAFYVPKDITARFAAKFRDTACAENDVLAIDPRVNLVDPDLHALFLSERERVLTDPSLATYAEQRARLIVLSRQVDRYESNNQPGEARAVLRQIAEEQGVVGGKAGAAKAAGPDATKDAVNEVVWTIVDPAKPSQ